MAWVALVSSCPDFTITLICGCEAWKSSTTDWKVFASRSVKKCQNSTVPLAVPVGTGASLSAEPLEQAVTSRALADSTAIPTTETLVDREVFTVPPERDGPLPGVADGFGRGIPEKGIPGVVQ